MTTYSIGELNKQREETSNRIIPSVIWDVKQSICRYVKQKLKHYWLECNQQEESSRNVGYEKQMSDSQHQVVMGDGGVEPATFHPPFHPQSDTLPFSQSAH